VVVTNLDAYEMPLIRYYLGDLAIRLPAEEYPEKTSLNFPLLKSIVGRDTDIVKTSSGKSMIVHFFTAIFEHIPSIKQFRVIQMHLSRITVEYIPDDAFDPNTLDIVRKKIHSHLNEDFPVDFVEVKHIPASPSGKPQIIVSTLRLD
jgi:phenylacetate-CoA ligase